MQKIHFNTSSSLKRKELSFLFNMHGIEIHFTQTDLREIYASHLEVITHKASQLPPGTFCEDVCFDVPGQSIGIEIKNKVDHLKHLAGHKATCTVLMAYHHPLDQKIYIYRGHVKGHIIKKNSDLHIPLSQPSTPGYGPFDPFFVPHSQKVSLARNKPYHLNARALAIEQWLKQQAFSIQPQIKSWHGPWQD